MIRRLLLVNILLFCCVHAIYAQSYKWVKGGGSTYTYSISGDYEQATQMCTDNNGNVYVVSNVGTLNILADTFYRATAFNSSLGLVHNLVASYSCDGTMRWAKLIEGWGNVTSGGIEYYNGSVYLTGDIYSSGTHYKHIGYDTTITTQNLRSFTVRIDTGGKFKWIRFVGPDISSTTTQTLYPGALAIDGQGYVHNFCLVKPGCALNSSFTTTIPGTYDLKYDTTGSLVGVSSVPGLDSVWMITKAVYSKQSNKWYATIQPQNDYWYYVYTNWNSAVAAFRSDNSLVWRDTTGMNGGIVGIDYKGGNELYVCGGGQSTDPFTLGGITVVNTIGYADAVIFKLDTNGSAHWVYNLMGDLGVTSLANVTIGANQRIGATGVFTGLGVHGTDTIRSTTGEGQNPLFVIVDSSGHTVKLDQFHGSGFYDKGTTIAADKAGNIYAGGQVANEINATGLAAYTTNGGNTDFYVMKYGYDCSCLTTPPAAAYTNTITGTVGAHTVTFTYTGTPGYDSVRWDFGDGGTSNSATPTYIYTAPGTYTVCVTVYTSCGSNTYCNSVVISSVAAENIMDSRIVVYPNPSNGQLIIENGEKGTTIRLYDLPGRLIYDGVINSGRDVIDMAQFKSGTYLLQLTDINGIRSVRTIMKQ